MQCHFDTTLHTGNVVELYGYGLAALSYEIRLYETLFYGLFGLT